MISTQIHTIKSMCSSDVYRKTASLLGLIFPCFDFVLPLGTCPIHKSLKQTRNNISTVI